MEYITTYTHRFLIHDRRAQGKRFYLVCDHVLKIPSGADACYFCYKMLIGILGNKSHGKDTISDYLVQQFNFTKDALAKPIKDICEILFHFDNDQLYGDKKEIKDEYWNVSARQVMQFIGTDLFRNQMGKLIPDMRSNFWIRHFEYKYYKMYQNKNIVVSDIRFQNEVDMIH